MGKGLLKEKFETLERISSFISSISDLHKLLEKIMEESKEILNAEASSLLLYDEKENVLFFEVATGEKGEIIKKVKLKMGEGIAGECAKERKIMNVKDVSKSKYFYSQADRISNFKTKNILAVPLLRKGKLLGVLEVINKKNGQSFTEEDEELMKIIANQSALCIENAYLYRENIRKTRLSTVAETMLALSHDIKNILNGLSGGIALVDESVENYKEENLKIGWRIIKANFEKISNLILDMLNFSTKKKPLYQEVKINNLLKSICESYKEKLEEKRCKFCFSFDSEIDKVMVDITGIERAILNLISNSSEVIPEGCGFIKISTKKLENGKYFQIIVEDNGGGIPEENLDKIFEVFFTTKGHKGTGLGLPVVKKIIEEHKGKIEVISEKGKGTSFILEIPVKPDYEK